MSIGDRQPTRPDIGPLLWKVHARSTTDTLCLQVKRQINHWDKNIRVVSSQALRKLVHRDTSYFTTKILHVLVESSLCPDLPTRHGCALGVAEVVLGLSECGCELGEELADKVVELVPAIERARLYRSVVRLVSFRMFVDSCLLLQRLSCAVV